MDLVLCMIVVGFFASTIIYMNYCDRLKDKKDE